MSCDRCSSPRARSKAARGTAARRPRLGTVVNAIISITIAFIFFITILLFLILTINYVVRMILFSGGGKRCSMFDALLNV